MRGPAVFGEDFGLQKKFAINEATGFELRADFFNAFNRAGRGNPVTEITDPQFGRITGSHWARETFRSQRGSLSRLCRFKLLTGRRSRAPAAARWHVWLCYVRASSGEYRSSLARAQSANSVLSHFGGNNQKRKALGLCESA